MTSARDLPATDLLLSTLECECLEFGPDEVKRSIREALQDLRRQLLGGARVEHSTLLERIRTELQSRQQRSLQPVINLTGIVLHSNLGRACLPEEALQAISLVAGQPTNLEFDLETGLRGDRDSHLEMLVCELTGAQAATVVNNNAAAVLLILSSLARGKQVPVSRGELVEIGGSFRVPEVMQTSGCQLVEVGSTNRTHRKDYQAAINADTALLMKVHCSNYRIEGFTAAVEEAELAELAKEQGIPSVSDLGSGCLIDLSQYGIPAEPSVRSILEAGIDLVCFSGDKLLGGPQCGIIAGSAELVKACKRNPLKRALRCDKLTIAALEAVLRLYRNPKMLPDSLPTLRKLLRPSREIREQAERLLPRLPKQYSARILACKSQIGSGALPIESLPSYGIALRFETDAALRALATRLRQQNPPIIGRLHDGELIFDLRCLEHEEDFLRGLGS